MRAASLFLVFVLAKCSVLWDQAGSFTLLAPLALFWQDSLAALLFACLELALSKLLVSDSIGRALYWSFVFYAAINIPVGRAVSTPLTWPMLRAARGPLADSMRAYVTVVNVFLMAGLVGVALIAPRLLARIPKTGFRYGVVAGLALVLVGPVVSKRVDTRGADRNVIAALIPMGLPRVSAASTGDWRESRFPESEAEDLSRFAGRARGFNLVMVSLESTAAQYLPLYGAPNDGRPDVMPHLTRLASRSLLFENAYAVYPESIKGLFSVLCSCYPAFGSQAEAYKDVDCRSVADILAEDGYRTALFHSGRFGYLGMESIIQNRGYQVLEDAGDIGGNHESSFGVDEPATVTRIFAWIDRLPRGQRFFLTYLPIAGHHPYATPQPGPYRGSGEVDQYRNALHYGDESLAALMEGLRARGLDQNTVWVIYGDHGEAFQQHPGNYGHTFFVYDENVHVPFLIAAPGFLNGQTRIGKVVSLVDTAPTILDLMGIPAPSEYQGHSMLNGTPRMALFFTDYSLGLLGLRDGPWKFIYEARSGRPKLFDLDRDPREQLDLAAHETERVSWYGGVVRGWSGAQKSYLERVTGRR